MATPVLAELRAAVSVGEGRLARAVSRLMEQQRHRLAAAARALPRLEDVLALASQRFDLAAGRLGAALEKNASAHERALVRIASRLSPSLLERPQRAKTERLAEVWSRAPLAIGRRLNRAEEALVGLDKLRLSFNPDGPLKRGFARVHHADGTLAREAGMLKSGEAIKLVFADGDRGAVVDGESVTPPRRAPTRKPEPGAATKAQGDLF
jgi:exodeoxyribonuclease VII large subunit